MSLTNKENVDRVMQGLPPEARAALNVMSQMQQRPPEDVLRDEIKNYIEGRLPRIDIEGAIKALQARSYQAGYIVGSLRKFARNWNREFQITQEKTPTIRRFFLGLCLSINPQCGFLRFLPQNGGRIFSFR